MLIIGTVISNISTNLVSDITLYARGWQLKMQHFLKIWIHAYEVIISSIVFIIIKLCQSHHWKHVVPWDIMARGQTEYTTPSLMCYPAQQVLSILSIWPRATAWMTVLIHIHILCSCGFYHLFINFIWYNAWYIQENESFKDFWVSNCNSECNLT